MAELYYDDIYSYYATEIYNLIANVEEKENKRDSSLTTFYRISEEFDCNIEMIAKNLIENFYDNGKILVLNKDGVLLKVNSISSDENNYYYLNISISNSIIEISKIIYF